MSGRFPSSLGLRISSLLVLRLGSVFSPNPDSYKARQTILPIAQNRRLPGDGALVCEWGCAARSAPNAGAAALNATVLALTRNRPLFSGFPPLGGL